MLWLNNLVNIAEKGEPGNCPKCGSANTDFGYTVVDIETRMGTGDVWCNESKSAYHISRIKINEPERIKNISSSLRY